MTPKKKAIKLVDNYKKWLNQIGESYSDKENAKQCALSAVNEILCMGIMSDSGDWQMAKSYWEEVKQEIEKL